MALILHKRIKYFETWITQFYLGHPDKFSKLLIIF